MLFKTIGDKRHGLVHLIGTYAIAITLLVGGLPFWWSLILACGCGFLWQCADALNQVRGWQVWFLDQRGADITDLLADLVGVILAALIWSL